MDYQRLDNFLRRYGTSYSIDISPGAVPSVTLTMPAELLDELIRDIETPPKITVDNTKINDGEYGVFRFPLGEIEANVLRQLFNNVVAQSAAPVIAIPYDTDFVGMKKSDLIRIKERICELIEASDFDGLVRQTKSD